MWAVTSTVGSTQVGCHSRNSIPLLVEHDDSIKALELINAHDVTLEMLECCFGFLLCLYMKSEYLFFIVIIIFIDKDVFTLITHNNAYSELSRSALIYSLSSCCCWRYSSVTRFLIMPAVNNIGLVSSSYLYITEIHLSHSDDIEFGIVSSRVDYLCHLGQQRIQHTQREEHSHWSFLIEVQRTHEDSHKTWLEKVGSDFTLSLCVGTLKYLH